jgi:predicted metal-binding protein
MRFSWPNQEHNLLGPGNMYYVDEAAGSCKTFVPLCQTACVMSQIIILIFSAINVKAHSLFNENGDCACYIKMEYPYALGPLHNKFVCKVSPQA